LLTSGSTPSYCAISYFAGNHKETEVIFVNGIRFNAFANLARALRQIVQAKERGYLKECPQLIWVDQICINQSNPAERSHQVSFMRNIFESASVVLACLGEDPSNGLWAEAAKRLDFDGMSTPDI
jgi:Heterokaryon incompatibility protein (HET)